MATRAVLTSRHLINLRCRSMPPVWWDHPRQTQPRGPFSCKWQIDHHTSSHSQRQRKPLGTADGPRDLARLARLAVIGKDRDLGPLDIKILLVGLSAILSSVHGAERCRMHEH